MARRGSDFVALDNGRGLPSKDGCADGEAAAHGPCHRLAPTRCNGPGGPPHRQALRGDRMATPDGGDRCRGGKKGGNWRKIGGGGGEPDVEGEGRGRLL